MTKPQTTYIMLTFNTYSLCNCLKIKQDNTFESFIQIVNKWLKKAKQTFSF